MDILSIVPAELQIFGGVLAGMVVGLIGIFSYVRKMKDPEEDSAAERFRLVGAALGDSAALASISDELQRIRVFLETQAQLQHQREAFMQSRPDPLVEVLKVLAAELRRSRLAHNHAPKGAQQGG